MKFFNVLVKVIFVFLSWLLAVAILGIVKADLIAKGSSALLSSVLWMAFPIMLINAFVYFYKGNLLTLACMDKAILKMKSMFDSLIIGRIFMFVIFGILSFWGAYLTMMGFHLLTLLMNFGLTLLGLLMLIIGLFICTFSNLYFKSW